MNLEDVLQKNAPLRNIHAGKRCFVIGNGPSINSMDLKLLEGEINIVVTSFFRHPDAKIVKPNYWVIADPSFWRKPEEHFLPVLDYAVTTALHTKLFVPSGGFEYFANIHMGPLIDPHFYHFEGSKNSSTIIDFTQGIPQNGNNVIMISLMLAYYMGCNPIYLVGCDHDFLKTTKEEYESKDIEHFYPSSKPNLPSEVMPWDEWHNAMKLIDLQYNQLKLYASLWGFNVFNATKGGCLDVFPRIEYETLFPHKYSCDFFAQTVPNSPDPFHLCEAAIGMIDAGDHQSALVLLERAQEININHQERVEGIEYLKAICLVNMGRYHEALMLARQDYSCNPSNRENSDALMLQLENVGLDREIIAQNA